MAQPSIGHHILMAFHRGQYFGIDFILYDLFIFWTHILKHSAYIVSLGR